MKKRLSKFFTSRYVHLCLGLIALYGISWPITSARHFERIVQCFRGYSRADYEARLCLQQENIPMWEFYRGEYREHLVRLTNDLFDYRETNQAATFFIQRGYLYEIWQEKRGSSYLLAKIIDRGTHHAAHHDDASFDYYLLGEKEIVPFSEYRDGEHGRAFVSAGRNAIYIHRDSVGPFIDWYFESLWGTELSSETCFYRGPLSHSLYRDLRPICEDVFTKKRYRNKNVAREYFREEAFRTYLPTMLAMGTRMEMDRNLQLRSAYQYQRALAWGLSIAPNYTMLRLLDPYSHHSHGECDVFVKRIWQEFSGRLDLDNPDKVTLEQISKAARDIFRKMEKTEIVKN